MIRQQIKKFTPLPLLNRLFGRSARAFALGVPKSGTTSVAGIFKRHCRADHEPHRPATVQDMQRHFLGEYSDEQLQATYRARDKQLLLALESNCFLAYRPDLLSATFPNARYVVTVRSPISWLDSIFDNNLNFLKESSPVIAKWHQVFFGNSETSAENADGPLIAKGLYPLDCYLAYWHRTYERCLRSLPASQRLIIGTNQISNRTREIGEFIGIETSSGRSDSNHENKTTEKHGVLQQLDRQYVNGRIDAHCQHLISEFKLQQLW